MTSRRTFLQTTALAAGAPAILRAATADRIRIGQIGTAHAHASGKMETIRKSAEYELVGLVEADPARRAAAEKSPIYAGVPILSEEQLLNTPGLQAVAVETEVKDLIPTALRCLQAGKHVHVDKPAGESLPEFKHLLDEAGHRHLTVQMGYMFRYNPAFQLCFQLLKEGALGEVFSIDAQMSKLMLGDARKPMLPYRGGTMFELGCHVIDAVITVLGKPTKVTPYTRSFAEDQFPDNQLAVIEYPKATVTVRSALLEVEGGVRRQFVVCGTKGTFDIRPLEPAAARLALLAPHGEWKRGYQDVSFPKGVGRYDRDFEDLAKVIRGEKKFGFTAEHDLAVQETVLLASGLPA